MIKKILIGAAVAVGLGLFFFGRDAASYVGAGFGAMKSAVRDSVPVEFEIERARQEIKALAPETVRHKQSIAKEEVEVRQLEERIAKLEARLTKEKEDILRLKKDLENGKQKATFEYAGRKYTAAQVQQDLANRFERYRTGEATLGDWRKIFEARQRSAEAARQKLEGMLAVRRQLEIEIENLEARQQIVAAAQTTASPAVDDSRLGRVKELVGELKTRLEVAEKVVAAESTIRDEIPLREPAARDVLEQIGAHFAERPAEDLAAND